jgi:hypothetical protein
MRCNFFATEDDLYPVLEHVEKARDIRYAVSTHHAAREVPTETSWKALVPFHATEQSYLVFEAQFPLALRPILQNSGKTVYAVDQLENPNSVSLIPGKTISQSLLLPGMVGTVASSGPAVSLLRAYKSAIAKHFVKINAYWAGPRATELWKKGARLTIGEQASPEFDLVGVPLRAV